MDSKAPQTWMSLLKKLISSCQEMTTLLQNDQEQFSQNAVLTLEQSNTQKTALLETIAAQMDALKTACVPGKSKNLLVELAAQANAFPQTLRSEWENLLKQLNSELEKCYHHIMTNRHIVHGNLQQLKSLWDKLMSIKPDEGNVYGRTGGMSR